MIYIDSYVEGTGLISIRNSDTGHSETVFPETLFDMFRCGLELVFTQENSEETSVSLYTFISRLFKVKGFEVNMLNFNSVPMLLVTVNKSKGVRGLDFLKTFNYCLWCPYTYSVSLGDYTNFLRLVDLALRR